MTSEEPGIERTLQARLAAYERWSHSRDREKAEKAAAAAHEVRLRLQILTVRHYAEEARQEISRMKDSIQFLTRIADEQDQFAGAFKAELAKISTGTADPEV